jgi:hypothetical protein
MGVLVFQISVLYVYVEVPKWTSLLTMGIRGLLTWPLTVHIQNWHELLVPLQVFFFFPRCTKDEGCCVHFHLTCLFVVSYCWNVSIANNNITDCFCNGTNKSCQFWMCTVKGHVNKPWIPIINKRNSDLSMDKSMLGDLDNLPEEGKLRMSSMIDYLQICEPI